MREAVESVIDVEQQKRGNRELTRSDKELLMREVIDQQVLIDSWGRDPRLPALAVTPEQRERAYVPIAEILRINITEFANYLRSVSPRTSSLSDAEFYVRYRTRLEKAYAALLMRLGDDEIQRRLEGR